MTLILDDLRAKQEAVIARKLEQLDERHKKILRREIAKAGRVQDVPQSVWDEIERDMRDEQIAALILLAIAIGDDWTTAAIKDQGVQARGYSRGQYGRYGMAAQNQANAVAAQATRTLRDRLTRKIEDAMASGPGAVGELTKQGIDDSLDSTFTKERRETVATDQTTSGMSTGQRGAKERAAGGDGAQTTAGQTVDIELYWVTERDNRVCPRCAPLHDKPEEIWSRVFPSGPGPSAHPNCRCSLRPVVVVTAKEKAE